MKKKSNPNETVAIGTVGSPSGLRGEVRINLYSQDSGNLKEGKVLLLKHAQKTGRSGNGAGSAAQGRTAAAGEGGESKTVAGRPETRPEIRAKIAAVRMQKDRPVIKLEGFADRTSVEPLRGMEVSIEAGDLEPLPEGEHYVRDLIGCSVVDIAAAGAAAADAIASGDAGSGAAETAAAPKSSESACSARGRTIGVLRDVIQNTAQSVLEIETPEGGTVLIPAVDAFLRNIDEEAGIIEVELIPGFY